MEKMKRDFTGSSRLVRLMLVGIYDFNNDLNTGLLVCMKPLVFRKKISTRTGIVLRPAGQDEEQFKKNIQIDFENHVKQKINRKPEITE